MHHNPVDVAVVGRAEGEGQLDGATTCGKRLCRFAGVRRIRLLADWRVVGAPLPPVSPTHYRWPSTMGMGAMMGDLPRVKVVSMKRKCIGTLLCATPITLYLHCHPGFVAGIVQFSAVVALVAFVGLGAYLLIFP